MARYGAETTAAQAVQTALFGVLSDPVTGLAVPVYDFVPDGAEFPYVTLGSGVEVRFDVHGRGGRSGLYVIDVWSRERGFKQAQEVAVAIDTLLDRSQATFSVPGFDVVLVQNVSTTLMTLSGLAMSGTGYPTRHIAMQYRVQLQVATP